VIFQFFKDEEKVGGGGRYDALIPLMGGGNIPASGFALYLDRLMNSVKLELPANFQGILIRAEPNEVEVLKEGFNIASNLREAGYVAELDLGCRKSADFRWLLDVSREPPIILTDQVKQERFELKTINEVLKLLRKMGKVP